MPAPRLLLGPLFIHVSLEAFKIQLQLVLDTGEKQGRELQGKHK